jgi:D-lactate dehydrogenase
MKIQFFSAKPYDKQFFEQYNSETGFELEFLETGLRPGTTSVVERGAAVCVFVNDQVNAEVIHALAEKGVKIIALRSAGFNHVDLDAARAAGIRVCRVPEYSPEAVAEHAMALLLTLNRKTHKAYNRVREQNFALNGLMGFNLHGKTIGVIGTGKIGKAFCKIAQGFGCRVVAYDIFPDEQLREAGVVYETLEEVLRISDVLKL